MDFIFTSIGFFFFLSWGFPCILKISIGLREKLEKNKEKSREKQEKKKEKKKRRVKSKVAASGSFSVCLIMKMSWKLSFGN